jgi:hypothetical protein
MKRLYLFVVILLVGTGAAYAQTSNCTQALRLMRSTYEQGRLHELGKQSEPCLNQPEGKGFSKEEKREAYRLITLSWIYLEEPEKADASMLQLLNASHFYEINKGVDPAEFIALFNKFRHDPIFRYGLKFGGNATQPQATELHNVGSTAAGHGSYGFGGNIQITAVFEKDLPKINKKLVIAPEIAWVSRSFKYSNPDLGLSDDDGTTPIASQEMAFKQSWLDLNAIVQYKLENRLARQTYVGLGPSISYLLGSTNTVTTTLGPLSSANKYTVTGPAVDDHESYKKLVYSVTVVVGAKLKVGELYLTGDVRYQYGISNVVDPAHRTNPEVAFDYQGQYNDFRMNNLAVNIGVLIPQFKPKKLIK